ncbi:hypothetical protein C8R44DRAFT_904796 [Mycena epipterygia]|nr:hypothetical protein C8R44DRAFT_904796 [Mycena epipterygia]
MSLALSNNFEILEWIPRNSEAAAYATVSRVWLHPVQSRIFRSIALDRRTDSDKLVFLKRVLAALELAPHLTRHVQRLDIVLSDIVLGRIAALHLPNMAACTIHSWVHLLSEMNTALPYIQKILRSTALENIRLNGHFFSPSILNLVLESCPSHLVTVDVTTVHLSTDTPSSLPSTQKTPLRALGYGCAVASWISDPGCPFTFSELQAVRIGESTDILDIPAQSIVKLDVLLLKDALNLNRFSALRRISVVVASWSLQEVINTVLNLDEGNELHTLSISTELDRLQGAPPSALKFPSPELLRQGAIDFNQPDLAFEEKLKGFDLALAACTKLGHLAVLELGALPGRRLSVAAASKARECFARCGERFKLHVLLDVRQEGGMMDTV